MPLKNDLDKKFDILVYGQRTIVYTTTEFPTRLALQKLSEDEQIEIVCERYKLWILDPAELLTKEPNSGYAVLTILNSYFDMIAQLHGISGDTSNCVKEGIKLVFGDELDKDPSNKDAVIKLLEKHLRDPMSHMAATKDRVILSEDYDDPLVWGLMRGEKGAELAIVVNPRRWHEQLKSHFQDYVSRLRDQSNTSERRAFLNRIQRGY